MIKLKIPYLRDQEIDYQAGVLLSAFADSSGREIKPPIDVEGIVEFHLDLDFRLLDLKKELGLPDVLGATWFEDGRIAVDTSIEREEGRLAFTLAHEIGHWILHRPLYEQQKRLMALIDDGDKGPAIVCREVEAKGQPEWQANQFGARLLMPAQFVREAARGAFGPKTPSWAGLRARLDRGEFDPQLKQVAAAVIREGAFSNVSNEAMRRRLVELHLVQDAAVASQGTLPW